MGLFTFKGNSKTFRDAEKKLLKPKKQTKTKKKKSKFSAKKLSQNVLKAKFSFR